MISKQPETNLFQNNTESEELKESEQINLNVEPDFLIACIEIDNDSASLVNVSLGLSKKKGDFTLIDENKALCHKRVNQIKTGCFPAKFVKIQFLKGTPISMKSIKIYGCQAGAENTLMADDKAI